ncbi:hypothetical protein [Ralstonia pseudosolanacearum]|uniref:hypothetical protein n=1 Tax=Ralstonia pseudosolanacearum TaxID=1310165 RepID=UPI0013C521EE|nr:hypothetical protein [Ralstonia pseudosolanacearum]
MSRNKKQANAQLFQSLALRVQERAIPDAPRYVSTAEGVERGWLVDGVVVGEFRFDSLNRILHIRYDTMACFVLVNFAAPPELPDELAVAPMNAGLFTLLGAECNIVSQVVDELQLHEVVFLPASADYNGHSWETLAPFFQPLTVLAIKSGGSFDGNGGIERAALYLSAGVASLRTLPFASNTLDACRELALDEHTQVPVSLLAHALVAVRWEHCFLEFYRCVERLFSLPTILALKDDLKISHAAVAVSSALERVIGWRKAEEPGLLTLLTECETACLHFHGKFVGLDATLHREYSTKMVAAHIYKLRNSIVHYRPATDLPTLNEQAWKLLLDFLVEIISFLYGKFRPELITTGAAASSAVPA